MRNITLDLSQSHRCSPKVFAGYEGEHNATNMAVILPEELLSLNEVTVLTPYFKTSCGEEFFLTPISLSEVSGNTIEILLPQPITKMGETRCQIEGVDNNGDVVMKTNTGILIFGNSIDAMGENAKLIIVNPKTINVLTSITGGLGTNSILLNDINSNAAIGDNSISAGCNTVAGFDNQTVLGKFNQSDESAAMIIGWGTSDEDRKNIFTVKQDGSAELLKQGETPNSILLKDALDSFKSTLPPIKSGQGEFSIIGNDLEHNKAYGEYSTALGYGTSAGKYAFTAGRNNIAGYGAVAFGVDSTALADYSFAAGDSVTALGKSSISIGYGEAIVPNSMYGMSNDEILDSWETIKYHIAKGYQSIALGNGCIALSTGSMALGANNASIGFFALASGCQTHAIGDYSATFGLKNVSNGRCAVVVGEYNAADGQGAFVGGVKSNAHSFYGFAYGNNVHAYAPYSIAMGYESSAGMADKIITESSNIFNGGANGKGAIALGWGADATYDFSAAIGTYVKTSTPSQVVFGKFNADNPNAVFIVGDGTSLNNKRNAFEVTSDGKAKVQNSTTSSDSGLTLATKDYVDDTITAQIGVMIGGSY